MRNTAYGTTGIGLLFGLAAMALPASGWAQMRAGSVTLSPMIGGYVFDKDQDLDDDIAYGLGLGYNFTERLAAEVMLNYVGTDEWRHGEDVNLYAYHLSGLYHFNPDGAIVPYLAVGAGALTLEQESGGERDTDPMVNYGGGFKFFFNEALALRGDIRHVYPMDEGRNNLLYTFGLTFVFGGVAEQPPTPPADSDGDGVIDFLDNCRDTPAGVAVDEHGCPKDSDGDGVLDAVDRCPNTPAGTPVDANGCAKDSDGDGVPDVTDRCPGTPAGTPVGVDGCPKDSDGDGVIDSRDQCPSTPAGAKVDARGCWVLQGVRFDSGKATLTPSSGAVLQEVLTVLKQNSSLKVEIQGHTDSTGSKDLNQRLSEARAKAVKAYFTASGIDADRLTVRGFGPDRPAASNDTQEGRAQNRRVELMPLP